MKRTMSVMAALLFSVVAVTLGTQSAYWTGNISSDFLPTDLSLLVAIGGGAWFFAQQEFASKKVMALAWAIFAPVVFVIIFFVGLYTACANGDCL